MRKRNYILLFAVLVCPIAKSSASTEESMHELTRVSIDFVMHKEATASDLLGSLHNGYAGLIEHGRKEAVPFLIDDLTEANEAIKEAEEKDEEIICTWIHLHDALKAQTGEDFGFDQEAWRDW